MEETRKNQLIEETLNLADLEGEEVNFNLEELRQNPGEFQKALIQAPDHLAFDPDRYLKVTEGFTPGALKNLVTISKTRIRVYAITETSIKFISCSDLPQDVSEKIFHRSYKSYSNLIFSKSTSSLQFIDGDSNSSILLKLDPDEGKLVFSKKIIFSIIHSPKVVRRLKGLPKPNKSKIDSFLHVKHAQELAWCRKVNFFRLRKNQAREWLNLTEMIRKLNSDQGRRFYLRIKKELPKNCRSMFSYSDVQKIDIFETRLAETSILCCYSFGAVILSLVSFDHRKVLWKRSINLLDLITIQRIREMVPWFQDEPEELDYSSGSESDEEDTQFQLYKAFFDKRSNSLILGVTKNEREMLIRIENIFSLKDKDLSTAAKCVVFDIERNSCPLVGEFSEGLILLKSSNKSRSLRTRPLSFLRMEDLGEEKIKGFEECEDFWAMSEETKDSDVIRLQLTPGKILIVTKMFAFLYDYHQEGRVLDRIRHTLFARKGTRISMLDETLTFSSPQAFHLVKTSTSDGGDRRFVDAKTIFLRNYFPNCNTKKFKFLKLNQDESIIMTSDDNNEFGMCNRQPDLISIKINNLTSEVVQVARRDLSSITADELNGQNFYSVGGLIIFVARPLKNEDSFSSLRSDDNRNQFPVLFSFLTLATEELEILDQCKQAKLIKPKKAIGGIIGSRVLTFGRSGELFLNEVYAKSRKLILLKRVRLEGGKILEFWNEDSYSPFSFCFQAIAHPAQRNPVEPPNGQRRSVVINFDSDLKVISSLSQSGFLNQRRLFSARGNKIMIFVKIRAMDYELWGFLLDLKSKEAEFAYWWRRSYLDPSFLIDSNGICSIIEAVDESIVMIKLN